MCGIAGFAGRAGGERGREASLRSMCAAIVHRGPDEEGRYLAPDVALGMRRLSIIDLAGGHQPITNEDATVTIVFNGEIYNYRELQLTLEARGHKFKTNSDTETVVHAYEEFAMHVRAALDGPPESRLTPEDIKEVIMMAAIYCGVPVANHAFGIATGILREKGLLAAPAQ